MRHASLTSSRVFSRKVLISSLISCLVARGRHRVTTLLELLRGLVDTFSEALTITLRGSSLNCCLLHVVFGDKVVISALFVTVRYHGRQLAAPIGLIK